MSVIKISKENFASEVLNSNKPVLLDFYADWCGPCRMVGPIVSEFAPNPMLAVIKNGKLENQVVGYRPKEQIEAML